MVHSVQEGVSLLEQTTNPAASGGKKNMRQTFWSKSACVRSEKSLYDSPSTVTSQLAYTNCAAATPEPTGTHRVSVPAACACQELGSCRMVICYAELLNMTIYS